MYRTLLVLHLKENLLKALLYQLKYFLYFLFICTSIKHNYDATNKGYLSYLVIP